jgi:hypothetical protein
MKQCESRTMRSVKEPMKNVARRVLSAKSYEQLAGFYSKVHQGFGEVRDLYGLAAWQNLLRLRRLHNIYLGRRCFIIANGPSLAQTDLRSLASEITIGSNGLFLMFDKMGYLPTLYTVQDYLVAEGFAEQINKIRGTTKLFPRELAYCLPPDSDTIYLNLLPDSYQRYIDKHMNENFRPKFSERLDKAAYDGCTVTYLNLQLAYYIGCRKVYLVGLDHRYEVPPDVDIRKDLIVVSPSDDVSHFHPNYFGKGFRYTTPRVDQMEKAYMVARDFAARKGMKILNATVGGQLEIFPRVRLEDVIGRGATTPN